jgi:hypothetical protein
VKVEYLLAGAAAFPEACLPAGQAVANEGVEFAFDDPFESTHDDVSDGDRSVRAALILSAVLLEEWEQVGISPLLWENVEDEAEVGEELESSEKVGSFCHEAKE